MSIHSYSRCWVHLVWATLDREPMLTKPAAAIASIEGDEQAVLEALDRLAVPPDGEVLGPVALDELGTDDAPVRPSSSRAH